MVKAGSAGSSPDGATTEKTAKSQPLDILLKEIGQAVFSLNTLVVGLDAVEKGHVKPDSLDISWNPTDRKIAARKSRKFVLEAVLVRVSEALNQYVLALSKLPRFTSLGVEHDSKKSNAQNLCAISTELLGSECYLIPAAMLLLHWRNRIVHVKSRAALSKDEEKILRTYDKEISEKYKNLCVDRLLCDFEEMRPTLKDISSLIAMSISLAREIDKALYRDLSKDDLDAWLDHYKVSFALKKVRAETASEKLDGAIRRTFKSLAPMLLEPYLEHYGDHHSSANSSS